MSSKPPSPDRRPDTPPVTPSSASAETAPTSGHTPGYPPERATAATPADAQAAAALDLASSSADSANADIPLPTDSTTPEDDSVMTPPPPPSTTAAGVPPSSVAPTAGGVPPGPTAATSATSATSATFPMPPLPSNASPAPSPLPPTAPTIAPTIAPTTAPIPAPPSPPTPPAAVPAPAAPASPPKYLKASTTAIVLMLVVMAVGIVLILRAWELGPFNSSVETTDNAYVRGAVTVLSPQVNGYVVEVLVKDFEDVQPGQPLVRIDDRLYQAAVDLAQAQRANAAAQFDNFAQTQAQNQATLSASRATLASAQAELARADAELGRVEALAQRGSVSLNERDRVRSSHRLAQVNVEKAKADIRIGEERVKATTVGRAGLRAQVEAADAQLAQARINLANTVVKAPAGGQVSEVSVRLGQYVSAGSQLLFLVPKQFWVVANFKETQTGRMDVGQPVSFKADALKGVKFTGRVQQIAPATGSEFSVLKADNATGNFTKVVQRLPVRIALDPDQAMTARLRPGMSVVVSVDTAASGAASGAANGTANGATPRAAPDAAGSAASAETRSGATGASRAGASP